MNQSKALNYEKPTNPPREWNSQNPAVNFKYFTSYPKTSPVVLDIMGRLNNHAVDNCDVKVYP